jgi:hypothetical protein
VAALGSPEDAAIWAHRILPVKNRLTAASARLLEEAFQSRMTALERETGEEEPSTPEAEVSKSAEAAPSGFNGAQGLRSELGSIDKSALAFPEPRRVRDKAHIKFVSRQPCLVCGRQPADAHHLRFSQHRALGRKVSDEFTVPLCRVHHREVHRRGDEAEWWSKSRLDPLAVASVLWAQTHPLRAGI